MSSSSSMSSTPSSTSTQVADPSLNDYIKAGLSKEQVLHIFQSTCIMQCSPNDTKAKDTAQVSTIQLGFTTEIRPNGEIAICLRPEVMLQPLYKASSLPAPIQPHASRIRLSSYAVKVTLLDPIEPLTCVSLAPQRALIGTGIDTLELNPVNRMTRVYPHEPVSWSGDVEELKLVEAQVSFPVYVARFSEYDLTKMGRHASPSSSTTTTTTKDPISLQVELTVYYEDRLSLGLDVHKRIAHTMRLSAHDIFHAAHTTYHPSEVDLVRTYAHRAIWAFSPSSSSSSPSSLLRRNPLCSRTQVDTDEPWREVKAFDSMQWVPWAYRGDAIVPDGWALEGGLKSVTMSMGTHARMIQKSLGRCQKEVVRIIGSTGVFELKLVQGRGAKAQRRQRA